MSIFIPTFSVLRRCVALNVCGVRVSGSRSIKRWVSPTLKELYKRRERLGPEIEKPRSSYLEWNYEAEVFAFGKRLGEEFDRDILKQALIQKEYANLQEIEAKNTGQYGTTNVDNYELIQEGNEIILNYVKTELCKKYPEDIAKAVTNYLTSEDMLSHIGSHIGLRDIVLTNEFPVAKDTLCKTFKAVVAALRLSQSLTQTEKFVNDFVLSQLNGKDVYEIWDPKEPYKYLTQLLHQRGIKDIEPRLCNQSATNTVLACFQVGLYSNKTLLGIGWGESVPIAKETAALDAIQRIYKNNTTHLKNT